MGYKHSYWVKFTKGDAACVEDETMEAARKQATELRGEVESLLPLPYPANPRISKEWGDCPPFCFTPSQCAGRGSCPKSHACSE